MESALTAFADLLRSRAIDLGLISEGDRDRVTPRHIEDSLRAVQLLGSANEVADIGSGAGLPGVPLAIARPDTSFVLVEPRRRAVAFLEMAVEELDLGNVEVLHARIEEVELEADVATARAFGPLDRSWAGACRVLRPGGRLIYFAGASWEPAEVEKVTEPEPPAAARTVDPELDSSSPLVIMTREE